jgi:two-component system, OmpR family, KDP operon response regulator KdpE
MLAAQSRVLIVDDEPGMRGLLSTILKTQGYLVSEATNGEAALAAAFAPNSIDVMLLDLTLPAVDGLTIIARLRASGSALPIVVLSNRDDELAKVTALDLGADDYITKPFGVPELLARLRAALRHRQPAMPTVFKCGPLHIDLVRRIVTLSSQEVKLTRKEYALLSFFAANAGKVLTHRDILDHIWGRETDTQYVRIYVRALRQKLNDQPEKPYYILTEQGVGYRFRETDEDSDPNT